MILTYLCILISVYVILRSFYELVHLLVHQNVPQKKLLLNYFNRLQNRERKKGILIEKIKNLVFKNEDGQKTNWVLVLLICIGCTLFGFILFQSVFYTILSGCLGLLYPRMVQKKKREKLQEAFVLQFRDAILSISNSLKAGNSLQIALLRCENDLHKQIGRQKLKPLLLEMKKLNNDIKFGLTVEEALLRFKEKNTYEEVQQFIDATLITKSKGGNLTEVIDNISQMISDKITIQQEIKLATASKRAEAGILTFMPLLLVFLLMLFNPSYLAPMYQTWFGTTLLFIAALMLILNYYVARAITSIKI
ncbi:type II secretion system F family protein [Robertmurraya korlensis]|uniref:type II secretion system F family protein n=1 Tax=Robertmurraya korlensis TaxID=519977 RepID=UPI00082492A6|nr:type II secretion system F family protein [Robertmurraya korlensis]